MKKPQKETYGWESPTPQDEAGWCIEGGEEAYYDALHEYYRLKAERGEPLIDREKFEQAFSDSISREKDRKEITLEDLKRVDVLLAMQPIPKAPIPWEIVDKQSKPALWSESESGKCPGCYGPCGICEDDATLARILRRRNLTEQQIKTSEYDYPKEWLAAIAAECHLGLVDIEVVLNALIRVSEKPQP